MFALVTAELKAILFFFFIFCIFKCSRMGVCYLYKKRLIKLLSSEETLKVKSEYQAICEETG